MPWALRLYGLPFNYKFVEECTFRCGTHYYIITRDTTEMMGNSKDVALRLNIQLRTRLRTRLRKRPHLYYSLEVSYLCFRNDQLDEAQGSQGERTPYH